MRLNLDAVALAPKGLSREFPRRAHRDPTDG